LRRHRKLASTSLAAVTTFAVLAILACGGSAVAAPRSCNVGAYVISLYDFDFARGTFGADLWLWSTCPSADLKPLEVMDFVNATQVTRSLAATSEIDGLHWSYVKVSGVFRHTWDVRSYPFDRHDLEILVENTNAPASAFSFAADREGSKPSRDIHIDGWRVTGFAIDEKTYVYDTIFGDPRFNGEAESDYARLSVSISVARAKFFSFVKLVAGVYVAVALSLLAFLLGPYNGRRRTNILVGTLFAVLVNMRVSESVIGRTESVTLVDQIHMVAMVYIFGIALAGIYAQWLHDSERVEDAARADATGLWVAALSYVIVNAALIASAALG
jgi:hypothetical protein